MCTNYSSTIYVFYKTVLLKQIPDPEAYNRR